MLGPGAGKCEIASSLKLMMRGLGADKCEMASG